MGVGAAVGLGVAAAGVYSANKQAGAAKKAAEMQQAGTDRSIDYLETATKPYRALGTDNIAEYQRMLDPGYRYNAVQQNPFLAGALDTVGQQVGSSYAAAGKYNSGGMMNALFQSNFGLLNSLGQQELQNRFAPVQFGGDVATGNASNVSSLITNNANAQGAARIAQGNAYGNMANSLVEGGMYAFSDERLKEDMTPIGKDADGMTVYSFKYKQPENPLFVGYSAQEVAEKDPGNVLLDKSGYLKVTGKYKPERVH